MTDVTRNATAASEPAAQRRLGSSRVAPDERCVDGIGPDRVLIADRQSDVRLDHERCRVLVRQVLAAEGVPSGTETAVTFVDAEEMAELNETHMGHLGPTDVLAFPLDFATGTRQSPGGLLAGDVVVCPAVAAANAAAGAGSRPGHDGSVTAEIDLLVVHGVLHLLGMDHAEPAEAAAMRARESEHLGRLWGRS